MRRPCCCPVFVVMLVPAWLARAPAVALAQSAAPSPTKTISGLGYGFGGVGAATVRGESSGTLHFGGGGEALIADAVGLGAEVGYLTFPESFGNGIGVFSVNGAYHFCPHQPSRKAWPFLTGGYTLKFREVHLSLWNFGGGVDYWLKPTIGLRVEFRDHVWRTYFKTSEIQSENVTAHFWGIRFGVIFR